MYDIKSTTIIAFNGWKLGVLSVIVAGDGRFQIGRHISEPWNKRCL